MSKKLKLSPWRKMSNPPTEIGLYKLKQPAGKRYIWSWWDGVFNGAWLSMEDAVLFKNWGDPGCARFATAWRGVLK